jgi:hypothetical protein
MGPRYSVYVLLCLLYGGGGIFPDVSLPYPPPSPVWSDAVQSDHLTLQWIGGYVDAHHGSFASLDSFAAAPALPDSALTEFRAFATAHGDTIPAGPAAHHRLQRMLELQLGEANWGESGYYRIAATSDPEIAAAVDALQRGRPLTGVSSSVDGVDAFSSLESFAGSRRMCSPFARNEAVRSDQRAAVEIRRSTWSEACPLRLIHAPADCALRSMKGDIATESTSRSPSPVAPE